MLEPALAPSDRGPSGRRFLLAMVLGHLLGAYGFIVTTFAFAALSDLWTEGPASITPASWARLAEGVLVFPLVTAVLGLWAAVLMLPSTLLASPIAWLAARRLRAGIPLTAGLGALVALVLAAVMFHDAPVVDLRPFALAAVTGALFAGGIWALCIRPRQRLEAMGSR